MTQIQPGKATICIVNYKTEELTRLCLRSIRKFTADYPYDVVVVDNDSGDASLEYLRSLKWIRLIERPGQVVKSGSWAHGTALDLGLDAAGTEFFVAMHSDTFVHKAGWLSEIAGLAKPDVACVGGGKLDLTPKWQLLLKQATDFQLWYRKLTSGKRRDFYIRTICGLYRTDILRKENLRFAMNVDDGVTCGKQLYYELVDRGYRTVPIPPYKMAGYIYHLAHATMVLNPEFKVRKRTEKKCRRELMKVLNSDMAREILSDNSLDK
ncbi:MAG: glycosyltransferase [Victivallales bacterium]